MGVQMFFYAGNYHRADPEARGPGGEGAEPHITHPLCWCEPQRTEIGADCAGRAMFLFDHTLSEPDLRGWGELNPLAGTGPYVEGAEPRIEVVQTTGLVLTARNMSEVEALLHHSPGPL